MKYGAHVKCETKSKQNKTERFMILKMCILIALGRDGEGGRGHPRPTFFTSQI